jgi:magnesium-transporting ATPase (P-type)
MRAPLLCIVVASVACVVASPAPSAAPRPALRPQLRRLALLRGGAASNPVLPAAGSFQELQPHSRSATECLTHFGVESQDGLSEERAAELARRYGPNALEVEAGPSALALFLGQFEDRLVQVTPGPQR